MPVSKIISANQTKDGTAIVGVTQGGSITNTKYTEHSKNPAHSIEKLNSLYNNPSYPRFSINKNIYNG